MIDIFHCLILYIFLISKFLEPYVEKTFYTFMWVLFIYINKPFIKAFRWCSQREERKLWSVKFYYPIKNQTYLNVLAILYFNWTMFTLMLIVGVNALLTSIWQTISMCSPFISFKKNGYWYQCILNYSQNCKLSPKL